MSVTTGNTIQFGLAVIGLTIVMGMAASCEKARQAEATTQYAIDRGLVECVELRQ